MHFHYTRKFYLYNEIKYYVLKIFLLFVHFYFYKDIKSFGDQYVTSIMTSRRSQQRSMTSKLKNKYRYHENTPCVQIWAFKLVRGV